MLIIITLLIFLISINLNLKSVLIFFKFFIYLFKNKKENKSISSEIILNEPNIEKNNIDKLFQENLPFVKNDTDNKNQTKKFILPSVKFLASPPKKESARA